MGIKYQHNGSEKLLEVKRGRPKQHSSYRQQFFTLLDTLTTMECIDVDCANRDKAVAYTYQKNATALHKRFAAIALAGGAVRIIRLQ